MATQDSTQSSDITDSRKSFLEIKVSASDEPSGDYRYEAKLNDDSGMFAAMALGTNPKDALRRLFGVLSRLDLEELPPYQVESSRAQPGSILTEPKH